MSKAKHAPTKSPVAKSLPKSVGDDVEVPLNLPTFQQPHLKWLRVCSCFPLDDGPLSKRIEQQEGTKKLETRFASKVGAAWVRLQTFRKQASEDTKSLEGRFLIECQLESWFPPSQANRIPPNTTEEVGEYLQLCFQQKAEATCCEGLFLIPQDKIPKRGFVGLMLEISAGVGKAEMNLTGATFDIQGRAPYGELRWRRRTVSHAGKVDQEAVEVTIAAEPGAEESSSCLEDVSIMLSRGIQEFVIEGGA
jgi:hypothetical protein